MGDCTDLFLGRRCDLIKEVGINLGYSANHMGPAKDGVSQVKNM